MDRTYSIGDTVYLNSGSPALTVLGYIEYTDTVVVTWKEDFGNGNLTVAVFPEACVKTALDNHL